MSEMILRGLKSVAKPLMTLFGITSRDIIENMGRWSVHAALRQSDSLDLVRKLREIVPDISKQESRASDETPYLEIKRRGTQAFQCKLMLEVLDGLGRDPITVVDIGDSAGTHMIYLKALTEGSTKVDTISVNLDPRAIEKIRAKGLKALQCRAEDLTQHEVIDGASVFTSFEMVEHLHNPALFFQRLATRSNCTRMIVTVPYVRLSRVGMHHIRAQAKEMQYAEDVHVFELSPPDWTLLMQHSGWRAVSASIYRQYPAGWPVISPLLAWYWRNVDFEGFWGVVLERDLRYSNLYADWEG